MRAVVGRKAKHGLNFKLFKCFFALSEVSFLGHTISSDGMHVDQENIAKIQYGPISNTTTKLRSFLGLTGYYRRFIGNLATTSAVLYSATSGIKKLRWIGEMLNTFHGLKKKMTEPPVLLFPSFEQPFIVETDAFSVSLGAVFSEKKKMGKYIVCSFLGVL